VPEEEAEQYINRAKNLVQHDLGLAIGNALIAIALLLQNSYPQRFVLGEDDHGQD
jgi:hypothetical protein